MIHPWKAIVAMLFWIVSFGVSAQTPIINQEIVTYVDKVMGTKVGRGECWDLAHDALENAGATWNHAFLFGKEVNPEKDSIYPGDIIQFNKVVIESKTDKGERIEKYGQHTAIVYEVLAPGVYRIAHQNNGYTGKTVGLSTLNLAHKKSGKIRFYRPVK